MTFATVRCGIPKSDHSLKAFLLLHSVELFVYEMVIHGHSNVVALYGAWSPLYFHAWTQKVIFSAFGI